MSLFEHFPKIPRGDNLQCRFTEKIDGTNAQIYIFDAQQEYKGIGSPKLEMKVGSRNRWITPENDNYGFARWVRDNQTMLLRLGPGRHYGEWWGAGIQRGYGLTEKCFSLFDAFRWSPERLAERELTGLVTAVPMLATCPVVDLGSTLAYVQSFLAERGSLAAPGFMCPEGFVVQIGEARFKVTDAKPGKKVRTELEMPPNGWHKQATLQEVFPDNPVAQVLVQSWDPEGGRPINPNLAAPAVGGGNIIWTDDTAWNKFRQVSDAVSVNAS